MMKVHNVKFDIIFVVKMWFKVHRKVNDIRKQIIAFHNEAYNQTDKMKLIILKFHIFKHILR